jgi:hypothetical protein
MGYFMYAVDHLVVSAPSLLAGRAWAEGLLDIEMSARGVHAQMGTHNHLVALEPQAYLEVIARDPEAQEPDHARWYGLDQFSGGPKLTNWVVRCENLDDAVATASQVSGLDLGRILSFERGDFQWRMAVPETGAPLFGGCFPSFIEWQSAHPAPSLAQCDLRLRRLKLMHPEGDALQAALAPFQSALDHVSISQSSTPALQAEIGTPTGEIWIA